jgi:hypothetical protein
MDEQTQGEFMHLVTLGKGKCPAHKAAQALAQGVVSAFDVACFPLALVTQA